MDRSGYRKDPPHQKLEFKEPIPTFLQFYDPNNATRATENYRLKKSRSQIRLISTKDSARVPIQNEEISKGTPVGIGNRKRTLTSHQSRSQRPDIYPEVRPEAGLVINDTVTINELNNKYPSKHQDTDPSEAKINQGMTKGNHSMTTTNFYSQELYNENYRVNMNPREIIDSTIHPLFKYVPSLQKGAEGEEPSMVESSTRVYMVNPNEKSISKATRPSYPVVTVGPPTITTFGGTKKETGQDL